MPTLISELSPLQQTWLYDNQLTRGDSYEEKWHRFDSAFDTTIFRSKSQKRKLPFAEYPIKSRRTNSSTERSMVIVTNGPRYPHTDDKLTWMQSFENLRVYCNHYGNCNVPQKYKDNSKLGRWVNKQRKKKKNPTKYGHLTEEQIQDLESLGFIWNQQ